MDPRALLKALQSDLDPFAKTGIIAGLKSVAIHREPDVVIGRGTVDPQPYMLRWWLVPRRKYDFNLYLHKFLRSDEDRALHDHPWSNISFILDGEYIEHVPRHAQDSAGPTIALHRKTGDIAYREATACHRIELFPDLSAFSITSAGRKPIEGALRPVWTLFMTGPKVRDWGFHCPQGWKTWQEFTGQTEDSGPIREAHILPGGGCGEQ